MRLYDHYINPERWDKDLPAELIPSIKHLRKAFDEYHWTYGQITEKFCYKYLHPSEAVEDINEYLKPLEQLKEIVGAEATQRFIGLRKTGTPPALFKAFFSLYLDGMTAATLAIFLQLVAVGKANEARLGLPHLEWAEAQSKNMIRSEMHAVEIWVRNVCDRQPYDPNEDMDERVFWRKWQAPRLLVMKPSRYIPYEAERTWERYTPEESRGLLQAHAEEYVIQIESRIEEAAGQAAVELAKQPKQAPAQSPAPVDPLPSFPSQSSRSATARGKIGPTRREQQKKKAQARYKSWQKEYRIIKAAHPEKSDVWISLRIARMDIAKGSSSETVRKHMKDK